MILNDNQMIMMGIVEMVVKSTRLKKLEVRKNNKTIILVEL